MFVINDEKFQLPYLTKGMIDFEHINMDGDSISVPLNTTNTNEFDEVIDLLHNKNREAYYTPVDVVEPEFEASLNRELDLVITMNNNRSYEFSLFNSADEVSADIQVGLSNDEFDLLKPWIHKTFEESYLIDQIREDVARTLNSSLPRKILDKMKLVADDLNGFRYRSSWISYDNQQCICCEIANYSDKKCPVKIVSFGFAA